MFEEYDCFVLRKPLDDASVPVGTTGVVLIVHDRQAGIYEVEFVDDDGRNLGKASTYSLGEEFMRPL